MDLSGKRWIVHDRDGNPIYLTDERWAHIIDANNHPELTPFEALVMAALHQGRRRQDPLNPRKYIYVAPSADLPNGYNHVVVVVLFGLTVDASGRSTANNYVTTAYFKYILPKR